MGNAFSLQRAVCRSPLAFIGTIQAILGTLVLKEFADIPAQHRKDNVVPHLFVLALLAASGCSWQPFLQGTSSQLGPADEDDQKNVQEHEEDQKKVEESFISKPTDYDCVIRMMSLAQFAKEKRIWLLRSVSSDFNPEDCQDVRIISVVGLFNKGKTFLLNKLFGLNLPSGKTQVTQGLSCVYLKERRMLLIDSPGVQSTVSYKSDSIDRVVDAQSTEAFLFELVSQLSDHIMFVVNDFTSFEQKYVQMFEQKEQFSHKAARELIVVHNLASTQDPQEAEGLFHKQITSRYDGVESHLGKLFYTARRNPPVHHFAICKEGSAAGDTFNHSNIRLLLEHLEHAKKLPEKVVLKELVRSKVDDLLPRFLLMGCDDAGGRNLEYHQYHEQEARAEEHFEDFPSHRKIGYFHVTCDKLDVKTEGVISDLGEVISYDKSFSPEPMIFDQKTSEYLTRTILFECPGVRPEGVRWDQQGEGLTIRIEKSKLIDEGSVTAVSSLRQQSGVYEKNFRFMDGPFEVSEDQCALEFGVLTIKLKKCFINKRGGLQSIQESRVEAVSYMPTSSLPSEAVGLCRAHTVSDAHPCVRTSGGNASKGFFKVSSNRGYCLTQDSVILTLAGPRQAAEMVSAGQGAVVFVALGGFGGCKGQDMPRPSLRVSDGAALVSACRIQGVHTELVALKWLGGEFHVTADHPLLVKAVGQSDWGLKEAGSVRPRKDELLVVPGPLADAALAGAGLHSVVITDVARYTSEQEVVEVEMGCPGDTLLVSSTSAKGPFVTLFGKQPDSSCFDNILVMELSRLPAALLDAIRTSDHLNNCQSLAGERQLESGAGLFLVKAHLCRVKSLQSHGRLSWLKGRHLILSAGYKKEIERLVRGLPRKHNLKVNWCKRLVEACQLFHPEDIPGERVVERRTFVAVEVASDAAPTTVSTTDARSATQRRNPR